MDGIYTLSRIYAGFMGFTSLGGILWFAGTLSRMIVIAGTIAGVSSLAASLVPPHKLSRHSIQRTLIALCVIGVGAELVLIMDALTISHGVEWDVVSMEILNITALTTMAVKALNWSSKPK